MKSHCFTKVWCNAQKFTLKLIFVHGCLLCIVNHHFTEFDLNQCVITFIRTPYSCLASPLVWRRLAAGCLIDGAGKLLARGSGPYCVAGGGAVLSPCSLFFFLPLFYTLCFSSPLLACCHRWLFYVAVTLIVLFDQLANIG